MAKRTTSNKKYDVQQLRAELDAAFPKGLIVADHTDNEHWYRNTSNGRRAASVTTKLGIIGKDYLKQWAVNQCLEHVGDNRHRLGSEWERVMEEAKYAHKNTLDTASDTGTKAHDVFDQYIQEWIDTESKPNKSAASFLKEGSRIEEVAACRSFDKFLSEYDLIPVGTETKIWYEKSKDCFAGTTDSIFLVLLVHKEREGSRMCQHDYESQDSGVWWCSKCSREVTPKLMLLDWKSSNSIRKNEYARQVVAYAKSVEVAANWKFDDIWIVRFDKKRADYEVLRVSDRQQAWKEALAIFRTFDTLQEQAGPLYEPLEQKLIITI